MNAFYPDFFYEKIEIIDFLDTTLKVYRKIKEIDKD